MEGPVLEGAMVGRDPSWRDPSRGREGPVLEVPVVAGREGAVVAGRDPSRGREGPAMEGPVLEGPVLEGPVMEGPAMEGPVLEGPVLEGPVLEGAMVHGATFIFFLELGFMEGPVRDARRPIAGFLKTCPQSEKMPGVCVVWVWGMGCG